MDEIIDEEKLKANVIKYNVDERMFYSPKTKSSIVKLYDYQTYLDNDYSYNFIKPLILRNKKIFIQDGD